MAHPLLCEVKVQTGHCVVEVDVSIVMWVVGACEREERRDGERARRRKGGREGGREGGGREEEKKGEKKGGEEEG